MSHRLTALFIGIVALAGLSGCGGGAKTGTVTGKVTHAGKPLAGGVITFFAPDTEEKTQMSFVINADGTYTAEGLPFGDLKVGIAPPPPAPTPDAPGKAAGGAGPAKQRLGQYTENGLEVPPDVAMAIDAARAIGVPQGPQFPSEYMDPVSSPLTFKLESPTAEYNADVP